MLFIENLTQEQIDRNREWIKALRSGRYKQCQEFLHKGNEYCCLGVACNLFNRRLWKPDNAWNEIFNYMESHAEMPDDMLAVYGLTGYGAGKLATMNDDGETFRTIADFIEEHLDNKVNEKAV